jgi:hypothetical protein
MAAACGFACAASSNLRELPMRRRSGETRLLLGMAGVLLATLLLLVLELVGPI